MNKRIFSQLRVSNFRRLRQLDLELRSLTVMIGVNGVGKTSILDALVLLSRSAKGELRSAISDLSGLPAILSRPGNLGLGITKQISNADSLMYDFALRPEGPGYAVGSEVLAQERGGPSPFQTISWTGYQDRQTNVMVEIHSTDDAETRLSKVPKQIRIAEAFRVELAFAAVYNSLDVDPRSWIRTPQPLRPATSQCKNGEDLISRLYQLRESDRDRYELVEDTVRGAFPTFQRFEFPPIAGGMLSMTWQENNRERALHMHQLSEGMLRFVWLVTLLQCSGAPRLTLIDNPEVGLHPDLLRYIAELLREASTRTQIIVATHSDRLVRFLDPSEVVALDSNEDGSTRARWADTLDLDEWLKDYNLDDLWMKGLVGARE